MVVTDVSHRNRRGCRVPTVWYLFSCISTLCPPTSKCLSMVAEVVKVGSDMAYKLPVHLVFARTRMNLC